MAVDVAGFYTRLRSRHPSLPACAGPRVHSSRTEHSMYCMFILNRMGPVPISLILLFSSSAVREHCCPGHALRLTHEGYGLLFTTNYAQAGSAHPVSFATGDRYRFGSACQAHCGFTHKSIALAALPETAEVDHGDSAPLAKV